MGGGIGAGGLGSAQPTSNTTTVTNTRFSWRNLLNWQQNNGSDSLGSDTLTADP